MGSQPYMEPPTPQPCLNPELTAAHPVTVTQVCVHQNPKMIHPSGCGAECWEGSLTSFGCCWGFAAPVTRCHFFELFILLSWPQAFAWIFMPFLPRPPR